MGHLQSWRDGSSLPRGFQGSPRQVLNWAIVWPQLEQRPPEGPFFHCYESLLSGTPQSGGAGVAKPWDSLTVRVFLGTVPKAPPWDAGGLDEAISSQNSKLLAVWGRSPNPCAPVPHLQDRDSISLPTSADEGTSVTKPGAPFFLLCPRVLSSQICEPIGEAAPHSIPPCRTAPPQSLT